MKRLFMAAALTVLMAAVPALARGAESSARAAGERVKHDFTTAWNAHDAKKMAAVFAEDGDLTNPFGRVVKGRGEIEKLFAEEHSGPMKASTYKIESSSMREIGSDVAVMDWAAVVTGTTGPDGNAAPDFRHTVTLVLVKKGGWIVESVRAYVFAPAPPPTGK